MKRTLERMKSQMLNLICHRLFHLWEWLGFHIIENHYYQPIPDTRTLGNVLWERRSEMPGININEQEQLKLLYLISSKFKKEYASFQKSKPSAPSQFFTDNSYYGAVDAEILYCMIRHFKPRKMFEIGSGWSTRLSAQAILKNQDEDKIDCELTAIEPYPDDILISGFHGLSELLRNQVQGIPMARFMKLGANDILFVDSSHVLKTGGDVQYEYLEILPRLQKGVIVHIHDIFTPAEYPREWLFRNHNFWTEQYLLQAFLAFNDSFEILWATNYMIIKYREQLEEAFSSFKINKSYSPSSFWIRKIK